LLKRFRDVNTTNIDTESYKLSGKVLEKRKCRTYCVFGSRSI